MKGLPLSNATRMSGERAFAMAGVSHGDFDHIMLYDAFTSGPPIMLESLGFAQPGQGVTFFENGKSTPGGSLPINTNGGGLSYTHTGMYGVFPIIDVYLRLAAQGERIAPALLEGRWFEIGNPERLAAARASLERQEHALGALSPLACLERGYAIVRQGALDGPVVRDAAALHPGCSRSLPWRVSGARRTMRNGRSHG